MIIKYIINIHAPFFLNIFVWEYYPSQEVEGKMLMCINFFHCGMSIWNISNLVDFFACLPMVDNTRA